MPVSILTDSAASLPKDITTAATISVVPMWLTIGDTSLHDGDLSLEEVLARIDEGITTSAPTPGEFEVALEEAGIDDGALVLTIAGTMSSTVQSAYVAAQSLDPERVHVFDTGTAAGAEGLVVLAAADAAARRALAGRSGGSGAAGRVAGPPGRDDRRPRPAGQERPGAGSGRMGGRWLGLQPMFEFRDGGAHALRPARSRSQGARSDPRDVDAERPGTVARRPRRQPCRCPPCTVARRRRGAARSSAGRHLGYGIVRRLVQSGDGHSHRTGSRRLGVVVGRRSRPINVTNARRSASRATTTRPAHTTCTYRRRTSALIAAPGVGIAAS